MLDIRVNEPTLPVLEESEASPARLSEVLNKAAELLPAQGPITAFVFLNTLQAFEHLPFDQGVKRGNRLFGCQPYLTEDQYREKLTHGRIFPDDLSAVLRDDLGSRGDEAVCSLGTRFDVRLAMLRYPLRTGRPEELRWYVAETSALTKFRPEAPPAARERFLEETRRWVMRDLRKDQPKGEQPSSPQDRSARHLLADLMQHFGESTIERWSLHTWETVALQSLWRICREGVHTVGNVASSHPPVIRQRDLLLEATGEDSDALVHDVLIRFCASFNDQGFAHWTLPDREQGFYRAFLNLYRQSAGPPDSWLHELPQELNRLELSGIGPLESILESLELLGVTPDQWDEFIPTTLLALRGWAGTIWQNEVRGDRVPLPVPSGTLLEFLAIRLILDRIALTYVAEHALDYEGPLSELRAAARAAIARHKVSSVEGRAFLVFQIAQALGWAPPALHHLSKSEWSQVIGEIESFNGFERRRLFQLAFERRYREQALDAIAIHSRRPVKRIENPRFQAVFCIDAREESFRRHMEETAPDTETFAAPGFYCIPIYYRGASDAHYATLCPIVVQPKHWVTEEVVLPLGQSHQRRAKTRRALGMATHRVHAHSRSFALGALLTACLGVLASAPLVARVLFPRLTARIRRTARRLVEAPIITRLRLQRLAAEPGPSGDHIGFTIDEMANFGERVLRDIGLTSGFARLVIFFGHGSVCLNNPHKSAYDCGACSGSAGSPNARTLAAMLNNYRVRRILADRGLDIPEETVFLGGLHNTGDDTVTFYDLDLLPMTHVKDYESARQTLEETCERNAHERCRRFDSAPLNLSLSEAHRHVEGRTEDLAQTRPEFGNATNALCVVGRRERTRGLYMDRRAFMHSYDCSQDDEEYTILGRILGPVVVVCAGINLQYYFSYVDSPGWGSGSKLPHNVTSLLGVMDGHASDIRTGLPWQGVEIHEPVRLLLVVEAPPEAMLKIMARNQAVGNILRNGWMQLAVLDPHSSEIQVFRDGQFEPYEPHAEELPKVRWSIDWYRGWRDHLGFASIEP